MNKLKTLYASVGIADASEFLEVYGMEDIVPGICMNKDCEFTAEYEPDQDAGWCEECDTGTVKSGLILLGVI